MLGWEGARAGLRWQGGRTGIHIYRWPSWPHIQLDTGKAARSAICSSSSMGSDPSVAALLPAAPPPAPLSRRAARRAARAALLARSKLLMPPPPPPPPGQLPGCCASRWAESSSVRTACLKAVGHTRCASVLQLSPRATSSSLRSVGVCGQPPGSVGAAHQPQACCVFRWCSACLEQAVLPTWPPKGAEVLNHWAIPL